MGSFQERVQGKYLLLLLRVVQEKVRSESGEACRNLSFDSKSNHEGDIIRSVDPVCRMECDEKSAIFKSEYNGKVYCFCSLSCKKKFEENPKKYLEFWGGL